MQRIRKREGFEGQRAIVLPKKILEVCAFTPPINSLYITDIGFYPRAAYHYRERPSGSSQNILIYCTEGRGWLQLSAGRFAIGPNEFLIIPADMPHAYGADEKNPWTIHWIHFRGTQSHYFASLLSRQNKDFVVYSAFIEERIRIFDTIYSTLESGYSLDNLLYSSLSLSYFLTSLNFAEKFVSVHHRTEKDSIDISIEYMLNHLDEALTLETMAS